MRATSKWLTGTICIVSILLCSGGCRQDQPETPKAETTPLPKTSVSITPSPIPERTRPPVYFSDLMSEGRFRIRETYREVWNSNPKLLRYNIAQNERSKSIFHPPIAIVDSSIEFDPLQIDHYTKLRFSTGIFPFRRQRTFGGVLFKIAIEGKGVKQRVIFEEQIETLDEWRDHIIDLSNYARKQISIVFITEPLENGNYSPAFWGTPRLINHGIQNEHLVKEISSAEKYEAIVNNYYKTPLPNGAVRVDRGWFVEASTTDILLPDMPGGTVVRNELYILEPSEVPEETLTIAILDSKDGVLASSNYRVAEEQRVITNIYETSEAPQVPAKIRITLDSEYPSVVFLKEPILYTSSPEPDTSKPHVILISLDTLRADHLGCYGYPKEVSPTIDAFAAESFLFSHAYSNANWTLPAHVSMFTSLYPSQHLATLKAWRDGDFQSYESPFAYITEAFKASGYVTIALTGGGYVNSRYGFNRGFDYHIEDIKELDGTSLDLLKSLVTANQNSPLFLFFHTYEIHDYYNEKPIYKQYIQGKFEHGDTHLLDLIDTRRLLEANERWNKSGRFDAIKEGVFPEAGIQYVHDLYDGAITYTDTWLDQFFQELQQMGIYDKAWIILTADHGEGFGEAHRYGGVTSWRHGFRLYDDQIKIPLIIKPPQGFIQDVPEDHTIATAAETIDIAPTLLSIMGGVQNEGFSGKSLLPFLSDAQPPSGDQVEFSIDITNRQFAVIDKGYKLIAVQARSRTAFTNTMKYELYNLLTDPAETVDITNSPKYAPIYNELKELLMAHLDEVFQHEALPLSSAPGDEGSKADGTEVDKRHLQRLRDLGYF